VHISVNAELIAWYGALLSTALFILEIAKHYRDRPAIQVRVDTLPSPFDPGGAHWYESGFVSLRAVNTGKRPVVLTGGWLTSTRGRPIEGKTTTSMIDVEPQRFPPWTLAEGEYIDVYYRVDAVKRQAAASRCRKFWAEFCDSSRRRFRRRWVLPKEPLRVPEPHPHSVPDPFADEERRAK